MPPKQTNSPVSSSQTPAGPTVQAPIQPSEPGVAPSQPPVMGNPNGFSSPSAVPVPPPAAIELNKSDKKRRKEQASTQNALLISEIRDGLVILRDGSFRSVVMCQSINFDLMSPNEREAVEFSYQGFLNTLFFPIQIFIRSHRVDLDQYINKLETIHLNQENVLVSLLMEDYIAYVRYLLEAANVMDKQFYVVIPYFPPLTEQGGVKKGIQNLMTLIRPKNNGPIVINEENYNRYKTELTQRVQVVMNSLNQMGVQAVPLNTQELIELYYTAYNPQTAANQQLTNVDDLEAPMVTKGRGEKPTASEGQI